ncbi:hypothetical protein ACF0H5_020565 [Mactra antiquata]
MATNASNNETKWQHDQVHWNPVIKVKYLAGRYYLKHYNLIWRVVWTVLLLGYTGFFIYAMYYRFGNASSTTLLGVTVFAVCIFGTKLLYKTVGNHVISFWRRHFKHDNNKRFFKIVNWTLRVGLFLGVAIYVTIDIAITQPRNLVSLAGLLVYLFLFYITSVNPARVIAIAPFFMAFINMLYYLGVMQAIISVIGRLLAFCMRTTPAESINAAANIFCSMTTSQLMIQPFLEDMTRSELHAVMTGGFATVAGGIMAAYINLGVPANHLLSASVMSAPAALAISKLSYPETEITKGSKKDFSFKDKGSERNIIEAITNGATLSLKIWAAIGTNVVAFLSLLGFVNSTLAWMGDRVGIENLSFELICSYVLFPVSFFMGVEPDDCGRVAELVGIKTFTNELIAYGNLQTYLENKKNLNNYTEYYNTTDWHWRNNDVVLNITNTVLKGGVLSGKSEVIATYALCGFANFGSIGITLGSLGTLAPSKKSDLSRMILRAMVCGNVACFLTACIAGLLYKPF